MILFLGILGWAGSSHAAATITAQSCNNTAALPHVQAAVNAANPGDTVVVPAGSCTWTSRLTITKGIILKGAGITETIITAGLDGDDSSTGDGNYLVVYTPATPANNETFRLTGFTFDCASRIQALKLENETLNILNKIRIDHNKFINGRDGTRFLLSYGTIYGVVDNNYFDKNTDIGQTMDFYALNATTWTNFSFTFGSADNMYFEDNTVTMDDVNHDIGLGGRFCARYNTYTHVNVARQWGGFEMHGNQPGANLSAMGAEVYGNIIDNHTLPQNLIFVGQRAGMALFFWNKILLWNDAVSAWAAAVEEYEDSINPPATGPTGQTQHVSSSYYWNNRYGTIGTNLLTFGATNMYMPHYEIKANQDFWNHNPSYNGTTQIGVYCGNALPANCTTGDGAWITIQSCSSVSANNVGVNPIEPISGTLYKCTAINTWEVYYIPYTYPHRVRTDCVNYPTLCDAGPPVSSNFLPEQFIQAESGQLTSMQTGVSGSDTYIYTATDNTGSARYVFDISQSGQYKLEAKVNSNNDSGTNSFYVGLNNESSQGNNLYTYALPIVSSFTWDDVNKVGTGTILPEFDPMTWNLTQGTHSFTLYGREANTWLDQIILKRVTTDTTPPSAPTGVVVR